MALAAILVGGAVAGLVVLYLTRPLPRDQPLSAARFFEESTGSQETSFRLRLERLLLSPPFYIQITVLLLLLLALLFSHHRIPLATEPEEQGLWIAVDTSASMTTAQGGGDRMAAARREIEAVLSQLANIEEDKPWCLGLATFDQALIIDEFDAPARRVSESVGDLAARALGTDLTLLRTLANQLANSRDGVCPATYLVVVTDMPAPDWVIDSDTVPKIVWRDVGDPVANVGISDIRWRGARGIGLSEAIEIELASYGDAQSTSTVVVRGPDGSEIASQPIDWDNPGAKRVTFEPPAVGEYSIALTTGGAYAYDDEAQIVVPPSDRIMVDWQLPDRTIPYLLRWQQETTTPHLRVLPFPGPLGKVPTLLVGPGYVTSPSDTRITYFVEGSPLLADLSLDVAENLRIEEVDLPEDSPLVPVMLGALPAADAPDRLWLATSDDPLAAYVPGLPQLVGDPDLSAFSTTAFFNALQWLVQGRQPDPLFTLTTAGLPEPEGNRVVLHPGEGNTAWPPLNSGEIEDIQPAQTLSSEIAIWPAILVAAIFLFALDRTLTYWVSRWR